ncbi:hypothetical protein FIU92_17670 (plasmid) [Ruegeria sp. THAF33]|nr:hypothetical protein FIU92_17670 [Ruegeria sp. THAF33]
MKDELLNNEEFVEEGQIASWTNWCKISRRTFLGSSLAITAAPALATRGDALDDIGLFFERSDDRRFVRVYAELGNLEAKRQSDAKDELLKTATKDEAVKLRHEKQRFLNEFAASREREFLWELDSFRYGPEAFFQLDAVSADSIDDGREHLLSVRNVRFARDFNRFVQFRFKRQRIGGRLCWRVRALTDFWSTGRTGSQFGLNALTSGGFVDLRSFARRSVNLIQDVSRTRINGTMRRVFNRLVSSRASLQVGLWADGDWSLEERKLGTAPLAAGHSDLRFSTLQMGWALPSTSVTRPITNDPVPTSDLRRLEASLDGVPGGAVVALGNFSEPERKVGETRKLTFGSGALPKIGLTYQIDPKNQIDPKSRDASQPYDEIVLRADERDGETVQSRMPREATLYVLGDWTTDLSVGVDAVGPLPGLSGALRRISRLRSSDRPTRDPFLFRNDITFGATHSARRARRLETPLGSLIVDTPPASDAPSEGPAYGSIFRDRAGLPVRYSMFATGSGTTSSVTLEWAEIALELIEAGFALKDAQYSRLTFEHAAFQLLYHRSGFSEPISGSYYVLDRGATADGAWCRIDLSLAKLKAARAWDLLNLNFRFAGLALEFVADAHEIVGLTNECMVIARPGENARSPDILDNRPTLVVEFPPQHLLEQAFFHPKDPDPPDVAREDPVSEAEKEAELLQLVPDGDAWDWSVYTPACSSLDGCKEIDPFVTDDVLLALSRLRIDKRISFRKEVLKRKIAKDKHGEMEVFADRFRTTAQAFNDGATVDLGFKTVLTKRQMPEDQLTYIGDLAMDPQASAIAREVARTIKNADVNAALQKLLHEARVAANRILSFQKTRETQAFSTDFDAAMALERQIASAVPRYALVRELWREEAIKELEQTATLPLETQNIEFALDFSFVDLSVKPTPSAVPSRAWAKDISGHLLNADATLIGRIAARLAGSVSPGGLAEARVSEPSRLAFKITCRDSVAVERVTHSRLDQPVDEENQLGKSRMDFSLSALTNWASMELAVTRRAATVWKPGTGGRLDPRSDRTEDLSAGAKLDALGFRVNVNSLDRLEDVRGVMRSPQALETSIELPARLILSPSDRAVFLSRKSVFNSVYSDIPVSADKISRVDPNCDLRPLFSARLFTGGIDPGIRAVASPDFRASFLWTGAADDAGRNLDVSYARLPGYGPPPAGNIAPWMLTRAETHAEGIGPRHLMERARAINPDEFKELEIDPKKTTKIEPGDYASDETYCAAVLAAAADEKPAVLPDIVRRMCVRLGLTVDHEKRILKRARAFRAALSANDRHQLVVLSSAFGLPVTGRRKSTGELVANSGQSEPDPRHVLGDLLPGSAIYIPPTLNVTELALTSLGGSVRADTSFVPPASARRLDGGALFDALTVEKWTQWTVLGRDVSTEVVYKGFLFPLGHRAALVKVTERTFYRDRLQPEQIRAYLRQRMFVRCTKPEKVYPAVGQANDGRAFPADQVTLLTTVTPDIADPYEGGGRVDIGRRPGLAFWPSLTALPGTEVRFEMNIGGQFTDLPLIFVDNTAANDEAALEILVQRYNEIETPDTSDGATRSAAIDPIKHMRTLRFGGAKMRYAPELESGSASIETSTWTLMAEGRERSVPRERRGAGADADIRNVEFRNTSFRFTPVLQGVDQPPFYPAVDTCHIRLRQNERLTGRVPDTPVIASFDGRYIKNGLPLYRQGEEGAESSEALVAIAEAAKEIGNGMQLFLRVLTPQAQSMGDKGDNSGAVFRPDGHIVALSRSKGAVTNFDGDENDWVVIPTPTPGADNVSVQRPSLAAEYNVPPKAEIAAKPVAAVPAVPEANQNPEDDVTEALRKARELYENLFSSDAKILGLVSIKDLFKFITEEFLEDPATGAPELAEMIQYGAGQVAGAAADAEEAAQNAQEFVKDKVLRPLKGALDTVQEHWAGLDTGLSQLQSASGTLIPSVTLQEVFPELWRGLQSLRAAINKAIGTEDPLEFTFACSEVYEAGQRFLNAIRVTAANPVQKFADTLISRVDLISGANLDISKVISDGVAEILGPFDPSNLPQELAQLIVGPGGTNDPYPWFAIPFPDSISGVDDAILQRIRQALMLRKRTVEDAVREFVENVLVKLLPPAAPPTPKKIEDVFKEEFAILAKKLGEALKRRIDAAIVVAKAEFAGTLPDDLARQLASLKAMYGLQDQGRSFLARLFIAADLPPAMTEMWRTEFERLKNAYTTAQALKKTIEDEPERLDVVAKRLIAFIEVFTGRLDFNVEEYCTFTGWTTLLDKIGKSLDLTKLAYCRIEELTLDPEVDNLCVYESGQISIMPPAGGDPDLCKTIHEAHGKIAEILEKLEDVDITDIAEKVNDKAENFVPSGKQEVADCVNGFIDFANVLKRELTKIRDAAGEAFCDLHNDALAVHALDASVQQALGQLGDFCKIGVLLKENKLAPATRQIDSFMKGRQELLKSLVVHFKSIVDAIGNVLKEDHIDKVLALAGIVQGLNVLIQLDKDDGGNRVETIVNEFKDLSEAFEEIAGDAATRLVGLIKPIVAQLAKTAAEVETALNGAIAEIEALRPPPNDNGQEAVIKRQLLAETIDKIDLTKLKGDAEDSREALEALSMELDKYPNGKTGFEAVNELQKIFEDIATNLAQPAERTALPAAAREEVVDAATQWINDQADEFIRLEEEGIEAAVKSLASIGEDILGYAVGEIYARADDFARASIGGVLPNSITANSLGLDPSDPLPERLTPAADMPNLGSVLGTDPGAEEQPRGLVHEVYVGLVALRQIILDAIKDEHGLLQDLSNKLQPQVVVGGTSTDRLTWATNGLATAFEPTAKPISDPANREFLRAFIQGWVDGEAAPVAIFTGLAEVLGQLLKGQLLDEIALDVVRDQIEEHILELVPSKIEMSYGFGTELSENMKKATAGIFEPRNKSKFRVDATIVIDFSNTISGVSDGIGNGGPQFAPPSVSAKAEGSLGPFDINLVGDFKAVKLIFAGARFITEDGRDPVFKVDFVDFEIGEELEFVQQLASYFTLSSDSGFFIEPTISPLGLKAGYALPSTTISIGTASFFNVAITASARLPFDGADARFGASLSRRRSPFTVSIAPYGGSGFFAIEANTKGIVGFEASFEFGGAGAFAFGPLTGQGRIMAGIYVRQTSLPDVGKVTEISGTFFAGGSANIWIFSFSSSLYVRLGMVNGDMSGEAVFTFSFSMGIKDFEFSVQVWKKEGKGFQPTQQASLHPSLRTLRRALHDGVQLASLQSENEFVEVVTVRDPVIRVKVDPPNGNWRDHRKYYDMTMVCEDLF